MKRIPLGRNQHGNEIFLLTPTGSNTIIITGMTGTGKSVITRTLISHESKHRPVYVFDWAGRDHYLGIKPNHHPTRLAPSDHARPIKGHYLYYPVEGARKKATWEQPIKPNIRKYNYKQLESLGFTGAGPANLQHVMAQTPDLRKVSGLLAAVRSNYNVARVSKDAIIRDLSIKVIDKGVWVTHSDADLNVNNAIKSGQNLIFSYNDLELARAEIDYFFRRLVKLVDENPRMPRPFIFVEEAHKIFAGKGDGVSEALENFVLVCRKLGIGVCLTMPHLETLNSAIAADIKEWIIGKLRGKSANLVGYYLNQDIQATVRGLRNSRRTGRGPMKQFVYYNTDEDAAFTFEPYECAQEYNRII